MLHPLDQHAACCPAAVQGSAQPGAVKCGCHACSSAPSSLCKMQAAVLWQRIGMTQHWSAGWVLVGMAARFMADLCTLAVCISRGSLM